MIKNVIFFTLLVIVSYLIIERYFINKSSQKFKNVNNLIAKKPKFSFEYLANRLNFIKSKDKYLKKQGYPLNLNSYSYYLVKFGMSLFFGTVALINYSSKILSIMIFVISYSLIDIYILINKKSRDAEILDDIFNVSNSISLQLSANITLKDSLKKQFEICKNKDFRKALLEFSMKYELSEYSVEKAINEMEEKFDIFELNLFLNALREYSNVENIIEILDNLSNTLKNKHIEKLREATRNKVLYITASVIIALRKYSNANLLSIIH